MCCLRPFDEPETPIAMNANLASLVLTILVAAVPAAAQTQAIPIELPAGPQPSPGALAPAQIDQLVAPIALYPDPVLTDILAAATSPAQVVEAARFAADHAGLQGAALADAAAGKNWEPGVQALLAFPGVLHMLDGNLEWTDQLGHAFAAQQGDVMDAIQRLRLAAERAGALQNGPDAAVVNDGGAITINPPSPQAVYLPAYDAACVYGAGGAGCVGSGDAIDWDAAGALPYGFGVWAVLDWGHRCLRGDLHGGGAGGRATGLGQPGSAWRNVVSPGFSRRIEAQSGDRYAYAPPAGGVRPGYGTRAPSAAHFAPASAGATPISPRVARAPGPSGVGRPGAAAMGFGGHR